MRALHRCRVDAAAAGAVAGAFEVKGLAGPRRLHRTQVLVHDVIAVVEVRAHGEVLALQVAGAEAVAVRQYHDAGLQAQGGGAGGHQAKHDEGILGVVAARIQPARGGARVVGDVTAAEAGLFQGLADGFHCVEVQELVGGVGAIEGKRCVDFHYVFLKVLGQFRWSRFIQAGAPSGVASGYDSRRVCQGSTISPVSVHLPALSRSQPQDAQAPPSTGMTVPVT
nr:hypothetical protein [Haliea sp. SAOS-164]